MIARSAIAPDGTRYVMNPNRRWLRIDPVTQTVVEMPLVWGPGTGWEMGEEVVLTLKQEEIEDFARRANYPLPKGSNALDLGWVSDDQMQHLGQLGTNDLVVSTLVRYWKNRYETDVRSNAAKMDIILKMLEVKHETHRDTVPEVQLESPSIEAGFNGTVATPTGSVGFPPAYFDDILRSLEAIPYKAPPSFGPGLGSGWLSGPARGPVFGTPVR